MIENGTLLQDRYLIEEKIGIGGMGAVYLAVDQRFDNHVAIKEAFYKDEQFGEAFEREARLLNALQHPVLPHVSDYFAEKDGYFLVMQYIEGSDLSHILKRQSAFPIEDVLRWMNDLLDALDYLHSQEPPIIHRDIKPHNLKLNARGGIMLLDFGLAKVSRQDATEVSVFGYSRTYSPLEQIQGTGTDARSDIFALGATVYHLLTGTAPINALTRVGEIVAGNPDPLKPVNELRPEISEAIAGVLNSALALNAENRFISAQAMRQALEYATAEKTSETTPAPAVLDEPKDENFPALESFASAKEPVGDEKPARVAEPSPIIVDVLPKRRLKKKDEQKRILWAAAALLLFVGIAAAFYLSSRGNSAEPNDQTNVNTNSSNANSNRESLADSRKKSTEKSKSDETKSEAEAVKASESSEQTAPTRRKSASSKNEEAVTDEETPTDADSEEPAAEPEVQPTVRKPREKPIPDVMTEQEFEQIKREEKQKRRQSRSNKPDELEN